MKTAIGDKMPLHGLLLANYATDLTATHSVTPIGINDTFGESGPAVALIKKYGLDAESIYNKVKAWV